MLTLDPVVEDGRWTDLSPAELCHGLSKLLSRETAFSQGGFEAAVLFADDAELRRLNYQFRAKDKPTNVLSFPASEPIMCSDDEPLYIGDIALSFDTIAREAEDQSKVFLHHVSHMIIHGVLHLIGHDHENDQQALAMEALEVSLLAKLGYPNPYEP